MNTFENKIAIISLSFYNSVCKSFFSIVIIEIKILTKMRNSTVFIAIKSTCSLYFTQTCVKGVVLREHVTMSTKEFLGNGNGNYSFLM